MRGSRPIEAEPLLRAAAEVLAGGASPNGLTRERVLLSLSYVRAELGNVSEGLAILAELEATPGTGLEGHIAGQRGIILMRAGQPGAAMEAIDTAVRLLPRQSPEYAQMLMNRAMAREPRGEFEAARRDLSECLELFVRYGLDYLAGQARHNFGVISYLSGDLPRALRELDSADEHLRRWPDLTYVFRVDRARVLSTAGLLDEAEAELELATRLLGRGGRRQDRAEIDLTRSQVALAAGQARQARVLARRASRRFGERGSPGWARMAELAAAQATLALGRVRTLEPVQLRGLADNLATDGQVDASRMAMLVLVRTHLALGQVGCARSLASGALRLRRRDSIEVRIAVRAVRAEVAEAEGEGARAAGQRRAGLVELHRYQATFGSLDLQTAVAVHGSPLAEAGLAAALGDGRPSTVLAWAERSRALASRLPPVRPPEDPDAAQALAQLRALRREQQEAGPSGRRGPRHRRLAADLERRVRDRSWYAPGPGDVEQPASLGQVQAALSSEGTLVAHMVSGGAVHALVVTHHRAWLLPLGPAATVLERLKRIRSDLDVLAVSGYPEGLRATVTASLRAGLAALDEVLWRPLTCGAGRRRDLTDDGPVVLVPAGALAAVPWTMLDGLRGRPLSVARSATAWLAQRRRMTVGRGAGDTAGLPVVAAGGPDLPHAEQEVRAVADLWPGGSSLVGQRASGGALLAALSGSTIVHVAAHGTHEVSNPMFSSLRLADGPLFGHDLVGAASAAEHVVLSACDLGRATARPGDELLGMTAAFLHTGTASVLASVARVSDAAAHGLTVAYHERLRRGQTPAVALAEVTRSSPAPFVCFGSAW